jgi:ABC-type lipoprotein export system ATPase subunit
VTHEDEVAAHAKRVIRLRDGEIQIDEQVSGREIFTPEQIASYQA